MQNIFAAVLALLGVFIFFILCKKKKNISDYTLVFLNLIIGLCLFVSLKAAPEMEPLNYFLHLTLPVLLFAVFMVYALQLISGKPWQRFYWLFFAFFIPMALYLYYDIFVAHEDFNSIQKDYFYHPPYIYHFFFKGNKIYAIVLCFILLKQLNTHTLNLQYKFSYIEKIRFEWLKHFTIGLVVIYSFSLLAFLAYNIRLIEQIEEVYMTLNSLIIIAFFYLSINGIKHRSLETIPNQTGGFYIQVGPEAPESKLPLAKSNNLKNDKSKKIYEEVLRVFEDTQLFTQRQLKLLDLAKQMGIPSHQLSQIINTYYGKPFYDFVASYRVDLLKDRLIDPVYEQFTILSIGLDCGFNSKSSLNRIFKEHTGQTPAQFRKSHLRK